MKEIYLVFLQIIALRVVFSMEISRNRNSREKFDRAHTGVVFSPYVKNWNATVTSANGGEISIPNWKSYAMSDVVYMLNLTASKFSHITTYSMGAGRANESWNTGDAAGLTPVAAAQVNLNSKSNVLSLVQGFWHAATTVLLNKEAGNALTAAELANSIYPKTVTGLVLSSFTWMDYYRTWKDTLAILKHYGPIVRQRVLQLGVRLDICEQIIQKSFPASGIDNLSPTDTTEDNETTFTNPKNLSDIEMIAKHSDFIICILFPRANTVWNGTQSAVSALGLQMLEQEAAFQKRNPNLTVTWETGWPSAGVSKFASENSVRNLQSFWKHMNDWASSHSKLVYMYSAFDEPWRTNPKSTKEITDPEGPNGADSHFGWWYLKDNQNIHTLAEKIPEVEIEPPTEISVFLVVGITLGILLPIILVLVWCLYSARKTIDRLTEEDITDFFEGIKGKSDGNENGDIMSNALQLPYDKNLELEKDCFFIDELEVLGKGAFGTVYKGRINGVEGIVAFKKPNAGISAAQLKNILSEIKIMMYIGPHENIVRLLGAHTKGIRDGQVYIASECCGMGSLESHLRKIPEILLAVDAADQIQLDAPNFDVRYVNANDMKRPIHGDYANAPKNVPIAGLIRWSYEIANAMVYLAEKKIVHADLATRNVLLTSEGTAKISDFGLSRRLYEYTQYVKQSQEPLPWRWMAIESLKNLTFSTYSDIWAYGVTLWEIFTLGGLPYPGLSWNVDFVDELERGLRMKQPKYSTPEIYDQMAQCWCEDPKKRPTFVDMRMYFGGLMENCKLEGKRTKVYSDMNLA